MKTTPTQPPISPYLVISIGIVAVSTASILIRYAQQEADSLAIAAYRLGIATLVLAPFALTSFRRELRVLSRQEWLLALLSGALLATHFATWITSLEFTTVASSVVLVTTTPIWVALFAPFMVQERITRTILIGMAMAMLGTLVIGVADICSFVGGLSCPPLASFFRGPVLFGDFLALAGAWSAAGYMLAGRRLRESLSATPYVFVVYGSAALLLLAIVGAFQVPLAGFPPITYLWLVLVGLIPQLIGHSAFNWALGYLPASLVSVTLLGEPIGTTILAVLLLREVPGPLNLFGAILILVGILIASRQSSTETQTDQPTGEHHAG